MKKLTKEQISKMNHSLSELCDWYHLLAPVTISSKEVALFNVDTNMGFVYSGPMANPLAVDKVPKIVELFTSANEKNIPIVCTTEGHNENCLEFNAFPPHCIIGSEEAKIIPELEKFKVDLTAHKNSTNAFHENEIKEWLSNNPNITSIVFCGFVTDICVMQLAVSVKTYCTNINRKMDVVICEPAVASYDLNVGDLQLNHNAELNHLMALRFMLDVGCIIASDVIFD